MQRLQARYWTVLLILAAIDVLIACTAIATKRFHLDDKELIAK